MLFFDPLYFLFLAPGILLALWASWRVKSTFAAASEIPAKSGVVGAQAADIVMRSGHVDGVAIEPVEGFLSDHYSPGEKVLRLSPDVYAGRSLAALGVAAHEAGHALQDAERYPLMGIRNLMVPLANFGSQASWIIMIVGFGLMVLHMAYLGHTVVLIGIAAFSLTVGFQLVNLPVEFDASRRARQRLLETGLVTPEEDREVKRVLDAAALTYVAATLTSILTLLYFLFRAGVLGGRDD
jgi:Zn-dependent membrane protease YugP